MEKDTEFNLSDKIFDSSKVNGSVAKIFAKDVKEFIKRLKEEFDDIEKYYKNDVMCFKDWAEDKIDKLAGPKLK